MIHVDKISALEFCPNWGKFKQKVQVKTKFLDASTITSHDRMKSLTCFSFVLSFSSEAIPVPILDSFHLKRAVMPKHTFPFEQSPCTTFILFHPHNCEPERTEVFCSLHSCAISQLFLRKTKNLYFGISSLNGMHATCLEASLYFLTHVLKTSSARGEKKGACSVSMTVRLVCLFGK